MGLRASHSASATPSSTVTPAARSCSQPRPATSGLGSADPYDDACDARFDDGFGARGLLAGVAAWLEGYVEGCAFGRDVSSSAVGKSGALRMKIAAACVPAFRDNFAIAHEHGSYERIGIRRIPRPRRASSIARRMYSISASLCATVASCLCLVSGRLQKEGGCGLRFPSCGR